MDPRAYIIITPVRNEGRHLQQTIDSVASQTLRPQKWIIVNDGSTDNTSQLIDAAAARHPWIETVHRGDRGFRKTGGGVIEAFNEGLRRVDGHSWEFIVKLDCDLVFGPDYFEELIGRFVADSRLGIASGVYVEQHPGNGEWNEVKMPAYHAAGASKVVRRECFAQIGGFIMNRGWDTVDEIKAMAKGWKTTHFRELKMKHLKPEGSSIGLVRTNVMLGEIYYLTGGSVGFLILKLAHRFVHRPVFVGGLAMFWGYLRMAARRKPTLVSAEEARCYRALLLGRITSRARRLLQIS